MEARNSLGSLSSHSGSLAGIAESDGDDTTPTGGGGGQDLYRGGRSSAENNGEAKVRLQMKSLSLQNGK